MFAYNSIVVFSAQCRRHSTAEPRVAYSRTLGSGPNDPTNLEEVLQSGGKRYGIEQRLDWNTKRATRVTLIFGAFVLPRPQVKTGHWFVTVNSNCRTTARLTSSAQHCVRSSALRPRYLSTYPAPAARPLVALGREPRVALMFVQLT